MKKLNIKDLEVEINTIEVLNAIASKKSLEIDFSGRLYINEKASIITPIIFRCENDFETSSIIDSEKTIKDNFKNYSPNVNKKLCRLKLVRAWQEIILLNQTKMVYFDHQTDGVEFFEDSVLEDIGWNCSPLDISYRQLSEFIESNCNGTLVYYDNGVQFNGFVIVDDIEDVRVKVKSFVINKINEMIKNDLLDLDDEEILESLTFFNIKV